MWKLQATVNCSDGVERTNRERKVMLEQIQAVLDRGYVIAPRDARVNTLYEGQYMVVEEGYDNMALPTADGSNGPWCIVGNDLADLINQAYRFAP